MTLRARIRIVPSRLLAAVGALVAGGAVALPFVVLFAWIDLPRLIPGTAAAMLGGFLLGRRVYRHAIAIGAIEVLISEDGGIELLGSEVDEMRDDASQQARNPLRGSYRLAAGSLAWPGLSVLALKPVDPHGGVASHGVVRIAVLRGDLNSEEARRLHRFMLWSLRGGAQSGAQGDATGQPPKP